MDKAPDAFRTISEVADELDIPQHVLRFWESRFPQIKPMKRAGGRRYYRPEDVDLLRGIKHLLYAEGYTIRGAQGILRDKGQKFVQSVWQPGAAEAADEPAREHGGGAGRSAGSARARCSVCSRRRRRAPIKSQRKSRPKRRPPKRAATGGRAAVVARECAQAAKRAA